MSRSELRLKDSEIVALRDQLAVVQRELQEALDHDAEHCACTHDGRGDLATECEEHRIIRAERDALQARAAQAEARASTLEDAAFHFQTCRICRADGEFGRSTCVDGQVFAAFLCGEPLPSAEAELAALRASPVDRPL